MISLNQACVAVMGAGAISVTAQGAIVVDLNSTFPTTAAVITAIPENAGANLPIKNNGGAQTFQLSEALTLETIFIEYSNTVMDATFTVEVYEVADTTAPSIDWSTLTNLLTGDATYTFAATSDATAKIMRIDFTGDDLLALNPSSGDAGYAIRITGSRNEGGSTGGSFVWYRTGSDSLYTLGDAYQGNGAAAGGSRDLALAIVPEPASLALLGLGGLAMASRRRG